MLSTLVLSVSVLLQLLAAGLALRLIKLTGNRLAWIFLAVAVFLMAVRRSITLGRIFFGGENSQYQPDPAAELVAFGISICMVFGLALLGPLFRSVKDSKMGRRAAEHALRESEERYRLVMEIAPSGCGPTRSMPFLIVSYGTLGGSKETQRMRTRSYHATRWQIP